MTSAFARQGVSRIKWYLILLVIIIAGIIFYVSSDGSVSPANKQSSASKHTTQNPGPESDTEAGVMTNNPLSSEDYNFAFCEDLFENSREARIDWGKASYEQWNHFLEQGYSLDDVTLAVEYFTNWNFAIDFRTAQLRKDTEETLQNEEANEMFREQAPELAAAHWSIELTVPANALESFAEKGQRDKARILTEHGATVNDVAYFLRKPDILDDDILLLLAYVPDPAAILTYKWEDAMSLLDIAVQTTRPRIVEALIQAGVRPTTDSYLSSTMEWAISGLQSSGERRDAAAAIMQMVLPLDAPARFDVKNRRRVEAALPRNIYRFNEEEIARLRQEYGIDLTQIRTREGISIDSDHPLIRELEAEFAELFEEATGIRNLDAYQAACEQMVEAVNQQWQPRRLHDVLKSVVAEYPEAPDRIKTELALIDPSLVDAFRERFEGNRQRSSRVDMPAEITDFLREDRIKDVIKHYASQELTDANLNFLRWRILDWDMAHYEELQRSGLVSEPLQYFDIQPRRLNIDSIQKLEDAGAAVRSHDTRQKTLLFYAVKYAKRELVTFLSERGYPFSFDDLGQDPMHAALDTTNYRFSREDVKEIVPLLMQYRPVIDEFHLSRMAVIQLKYPATYHTLVDQYPQLEVPPGTDFPKVR